MLIGLGGRTDLEDRETRATAIALHRVIQQLNQPVDIVHFDSRHAKPGWITHLGLKPVYRRRLNQPTPGGKYQWLL